MLFKARICRDLFTQTFNQSGQDQQSDDTAGKKGIEVRVQKIKKRVSKHALLFSERQNIVRFIIHHVEIYTLLWCIPHYWRSDVPGCTKQFAMKRQFILRMCDFELKL